MRRHAALAAAVAATVAAAPAPANLQAIECALHNVALTVALYNLENTSYVYDSLTAALNLQEVCGTGAGGGGVRGGAVLNDEAVAALAASRAAFARGAWPTRPAVPYPTAAATAFYVAPGGSDAAAGTAAAPFATLARAQAAMRGVPVATRQAGGAAVWIAGGVYHLNATLLLTPEDSYVTWSALPGDPAGPVVLTGSLDLSGASWAPVSAGSSILVTKVSLPDARRDAWAARGRAGAAPPVATNQLFVDGRRMVRARWPNANPEGGDGLCFSKPQRPGEGCGGYTTCVTTQLGTQPAPPAAWNVPPNLTPNRGNSPTLGCNGCGDSYGTFSMYSVYPPPEGHPVYNVPLPGLGFPNASVFSAWPSPFSRAAGVAIDTRCASGLAPLLPALAAGPADTAVVHMFHGMLWGGWQFVVGGVAPGGSSANLTFSYGGYQEARGGPINGGTHWYIENALPLLDAPGEWFYDADAGELYLWPNGTAPFSGAVTVPALEALIRVQGVNGSAPGGADYVTGVGFVGLTFTQTRATFLEQYEVPSGGDWSIHRGGALVVEDAEELLLANCTFSHVGGNAVLLSNHVWRANLTANEAVYPGDSGFALVGSAVLADGSAPTYPNQVTIDFNHIHEIGVYGKQTSAVFLAKSANVSVLNNVFYNGPRALINFNGERRGDQGWRRWDDPAARLCASALLPYSLTNCCRRLCGRPPHGPQPHVQCRARDGRPRAAQLLGPAAVLDAERH